MRITVEEEAANSRAKEEKLQQAVDEHNANWKDRYAEEFEHPLTRTIKFTTTLCGTRYQTIPNNCIFLPKMNTHSCRT